MANSNWIVNRFELINLLLTQILYLYITKYGSVFSVDTQNDKEDIGCLGIIEKKFTSWLVWLNGLSADLWTKGSPVRFPVRAHVWVAGHVPSRGCARGNHTLMFLSLSFSLLSPLSKNKYIKSKENKRNLQNWWVNACEDVWRTTQQNDVLPVHRNSSIMRYV